MSIILQKTSQTNSHYNENQLTIFPHGLIYHMAWIAFKAHLSDIFKLLASYYVINHDTLLISYQLEIELLL